VSVVDVGGIFREEGSLHLLLAPLVPESEDGFREALSYDLMMRGGGSFGPADRRRLRMMREGALFRRPVSGRLVDISPDPNPLPHPVYRLGAGFFIPIGGRP
jgi:CRISPR-associated protein Csm4